MGDFLVRRDDLRATRIADAPEPQLGEGQALLAVRRVGVTANNVTYAVMGDAMDYWRFFPAPEGWGRIPMWGFAEIADSRVDEVEPGGRVFGYLPPSAHLIVDVAAAGHRGFLNAAPHLEGLPSAYHRYLQSADDPFYEERYEDEQALLRPLFFTSFLIDDDLGDGGLAGASAVVLSSASSKTALAAAFMLAQRDDVEVVGLTSARNAEFVEGLSIYDEVLAYDDLESLRSEPTAFVDVAGDGELHGRVHRALSGSLTASIRVGASHWEGVVSDPGEVPGPKSRFFFAPDRVKKRNADWERDGLERRVAEAWGPFVTWFSEWIELDRRQGIEGLRDSYLEVLEGEVPPSRAHVVEL